MNGWRVIDRPVRIPVPGDKLIEEVFGRVSTGDDRMSVAHMIAPPGWGEPAQKPRFGELTVLVRGRMRVELGEDATPIELAAGQALWVEADVRVRYANPFDAEAEYFAICLPAFAPDLARRES